MASESSGTADPQVNLPSKEEVEKQDHTEAAVTWKSMPHKGQLAILMLARFAEPLVQGSLQSYVFYQLKDFDPSLSDGVVSTQAGILSVIFTGAQFFTAMLWGQWSDDERMGRKAVILVGLVGSIVTTIGYGFTKTFWSAMIFRIAGGALNGNVGVMKTMLSEIVQDQKYLPTAFMLFPMSYNIGVIVGPILGGIMAEPATTYPGAFGHVEWMKTYPYAPANLFAALILLATALSVFFGLEETLRPLQFQEDIGLRCARKIRRIFMRSDATHRYTALPGSDDIRGSFDIELTPSTPTMPQPPGKPVARWRQKLPFCRMFTPNLIFTLIAHTFTAMHFSVFNNLWFIFLSTPVFDPKRPSPHHYHPKLPFKFTGGVGLPPHDVGLAMSALGFIGIVMQIFIYPSASHKLGLVRSWKIFLLCPPIAYLLAPYLAVIPSQTPPPAKKDGILVWISICAVLFIQVLGRTFVMPATNILVNNSCPHPSVLGTTHGLGQSFNSAGRTIGPIVGSVLYGVGLQKGYVGAVWWGLSGLALLNWGSSFLVRNSNGHEIKLDGDDEAEEEFQTANREAIEVQKDRQRFEHDTNQASST